MATFFSAISVIIILVLLAAQLSEAGATMLGSLLEWLLELIGINAKAGEPNPRLQKPMRTIDLVCFVAEHDDHHLAEMSRLKREFHTV